MIDLPEVEGVSHRWVETRGLKFHVAEAGSGDDVVLCLHGWPQHWFEWRHLFNILHPWLRGFRATFPYACALPTSC